MPCYHPLPGWYAKRANDKTRKRPVVFTFGEGFKDRKAEIPCGRCIGCRLEKARQWAARCVHESQLHQRNCFLTLTYNQGSVPEVKSSIDGTSLPSLRPRDFTLFMKRLRERYGAGIRFFQCGEYGDQLGRPHHHVLLFGHDFDDKRRLCGKADAHALYESDQLNELWPHGFASIGRLTFESAGYTVRYALKKIGGKPAEAHYQGRVPEYATMSRRPGIGTEWLRKYAADVYPRGEVVIQGRRMKPPRFYNDKYPQLAERDNEKKTRQRNVEMLRRENRKARNRDTNATGKRLLVREEVKQAQVRTLSRNLEGTTTK
ncbi:MAG: replication initiator protein [Microvirus sp.]|nr:MAG: replication initiator protein [Microvirus sp.]